MFWLPFFDFDFFARIPVALEHHFFLLLRTEFVPSLERALMPRLGRWDRSVLDRRPALRVFGAVDVACAGAWLLTHHRELEPLALAAEMRVLFEQPIALLG